MLASLAADAAPGGRGHPQVLETSPRPSFAATTSAIREMVRMRSSSRSSYTLLIDADLRRGRLHRGLTLRRQPGLTDLLVGDTSLEQTVQTTTYPSLDFLASGSRRRDAPDLMASAAMADLVTSLRSRYGAVVVYTPPPGPRLDAVLTAMRPW